MKLPKLDSAQRRRDGNLVASDNEERTLLAVAKFGHLRATELGALVWPESPPTSATEMARRTARRLIERGELLARPNALGGTSFVLSSAGAARCNAAWGTRAADGYDIQGVRGGTFWHRTLGTAYLAHRFREGADVWGEYAIARGWGPMSLRDLRHRYGKLPDCIVRRPAAEAVASGLDVETKAYDWVEVESAYKPDMEILRAILLAQHLEGEFGDGILHRIVFVFDTAERHEAHIKRVARGRLPQLELMGHASVADAIRLARCRISRPLSLLAVDETSLSD